ncbi:MAG: hypothetical protein ACOYB7_02485 [Mycobacterium sp.]
MSTYGTSEPPRDPRIIERDPQGTTRTLPQQHHADLGLADVEHTAGGDAA